MVGERPTFFHSKWKFHALRLTFEWRANRDGIVVTLFVHIALSPIRVEITQPTDAVPVLSDFGL